MVKTEHEALESQSTRISTSTQKTLAIPTAINMTENSAHDHHDKHTRLAETTTVTRSGQSPAGAPKAGNVTGTSQDNSKTEMGKDSKNVTTSSPRQTTATPQQRKDSRPTTTGRSRATGQSTARTKGKHSPQH
jgi:hypothetical protein